MTNEDLQLLPTDDLINALIARFDHAVFSGMKTGLNDGKHLTLRRWTGNSATCSGLCSQLDFRINENCFEEASSPDGTDEL